VSNPFDLDAEQVCLGVSIMAVLSRFTARRIDDALLAEMAEVLNEEFASLRASRRIILTSNGSAINVELTPEEQDTGLAPNQRQAAAVGFDAVAAALAA
jgi:uncharacterized protein YejL (UPF0352 family)